MTQHSMLHTSAQCQGQCRGRRNVIIIVTVIVKLKSMNVRVILVNMMVDVRIKLVDMNANVFLNGKVKIAKCLLIYANQIHAVMGFVV